MGTSSEITVNIRNIAVGGAGVGEVVAQSGEEGDLLGITAFVPFAAVGEQVAAHIIERKERYVKAQIVEVEKPSSTRVEPACPYFMNCGGCELQHISYQGQLEAKQEMVRGALQAGKLDIKAVSALKTIVPGEPYGYRRRLTLHVDASGRIGFYRERSRSVVAVRSCPVASDEINRALAVIEGFGGETRGAISSIQLEEDGDGLVAVLTAPYDLGEDERKQILAAAKNYFSNVVLLAGGKEAGGFSRQILELPLNAKGTFTLRLPAGAFSQVNWDVNLALINRLVKLADISYGTTVYDLYAGAGNFTLPLGRVGAQVTAVECDPRLVAFGRENVVRHHLQKKVEFVESSVEKFLGTSKRKNTAELVVVDPPRSGLGQLVNSVGFAKRLLFVSCHLPSFVRDVKALTERGWEVESIEPFDMFAQTSYVEILGVLRRGD